MSNMQEVTEALNKAQEELNWFKEQLQATVQWRCYQVAIQKEGQLKRQLEFIKSEAIRAELENEFECVTGHEYDYYTNEFLIVHRDTPYITSIAGADGIWTIGMKGKTSLPREADALILAADCTEKGAWKRAVEKWESIDEWQHNLFLGKS